MHLSGRYCAILLALVTSVAYAASVENLYTASVPVADDTEAEFKRGLVVAFQVVLVKLTGNSASAERQGVRALAARAQQYNTAFGYERDPLGGLRLRADFDVPAASAALRQRGFKVWGKERPELTAILVVIDTGGVTAIADEVHQTIFDALPAQAAIRAIPLRRALPDSATMNSLAEQVSDDDMIVDLQTVGAGDPVSARLVGLLRQAVDGTWRARWHLSLEDAPLEWTTSGDLPTTLVTAGVDRAADEIFQHFVNAVEASGESSVRLTVLGINTADDYGRVLNYLGSLDAVASLGVARVEGTQVVFALDTRGGLPILAQTISFGHVLSPVADDAAAYQLNSP
ncbi:MAG: DUF2066 domain-containing protein [Gammaproteobacteria bacterium]